jgi:hypothetical protein
MTISVQPGVTCLAIPRSEWDEGKIDGVIFHLVKEVLVFGPEHVLLTAYQPHEGNVWEPYALMGWYGFVRGGTWVLLIQRKHVQGVDD